MAISYIKPSVDNCPRLLRQLLMLWLDIWGQNENSHVITCKYYQLSVNFIFRDFCSAYLSVTVSGCQLCIPTTVRRLLEVLNFKMSKMSMKYFGVFVTSTR